MKAISLNDAWTGQADCLSCTLHNSVLFAGLEEGDGGIVVDLLGVHRPDHGDLVGDRSDVRQGAADFEAALDSARREAAAAFGDERMLVERCLVRDRMRRLRDIGEARIVLQDVIDRPEEAPEPDAPAAESAGSTTGRLAWAIAAVASVIAAVGFLWNPHDADTAEPTRRFALEVPNSGNTRQGDGTAVAISSTDAGRRLPSLPSSSRPPPHTLEHTLGEPVQAYPGSTWQAGLQPSPAAVLLSSLISMTSRTSAATRTAFLSSFDMPALRSASQPRSDQEE